jgi:hypothetical protein
MPNKHGGSAMATGQEKWRVTVQNKSTMEMGVQQELTGPVTRVLLYDAFFFGTFLPFLRALDRPIAIACFRLLTRPPLPLFALPRL